MPCEIRMQPAITEPEEPSQLVLDERGTECRAGRAEPGVSIPYTFPHRPTEDAATGTVVVWRVPQGTSAASLDVGGLQLRGLLLWQRPVGGVAAFVVDRPSFDLAFLNAWAVDGASIGRIGFNSGATVIDFPGTVEGVLPDGRAYRVSGLQQGGERVTGIAAGVVIDFETGESPAIGIVNYFGGPSSSAEPFWSGDTLVVPAGDRSIRIAVYDDMLERLGPEGRDLLAGSVRGYSVGELPVLELSPPLRFAADHELPLAMEVEYQTFVIRRGCEPRLGAVCSEDGLVQAIPLRSLVSGVPRLPPNTIQIESVPSAVPEVSAPPLEPIWSSSLPALRIEGQRAEGGFAFKVASITGEAFVVVLPDATTAELRPDAPIVVDGAALTPRQLLTTADPPAAVEPYFPLSEPAVVTSRLTERGAVVAVWGADGYANTLTTVDLGTWTLVLDGPDLLSSKIADALSWEEDSSAMLRITSLDPDVILLEDWAGIQLEMVDQSALVIVLPGCDLTAKQPNLGGSVIGAELEVHPSGGRWCANGRYFVEVITDDEAQLRSLYEGLRVLQRVE